MIELVQAEVIEYLTAFIKRLQAGDAQPFHAVFSDPPYFLGSIVKRFGKPGSKPAKHGKDGAFTRQSKGFMGATWDGFESPQAFQDWCEQWGGLLIQACYPGAVGIFYGGTRTVHRLECGLENAGWEIFDRGLYLYGSGMPHSHNVGLAIDKALGAERDKMPRDRIDRDKPKTGAKSGSFSNSNNPSEQYAEPITDESRAWDGYGTLLKPAYEPIVFARAPRGKYTFAECAMQFGTGALNIDGCRIGTGDDRESGGMTGVGAIFGKGSSTEKLERATGGRWPANVVFDDSAAELLDEQTGESESVRSDRGRGLSSHGSHDGWKRPAHDNPENQHGVRGYDDSGGASRFFYSSKAPQWEREAGLDQFPLQDGSIGDRRPSGSMSQRVHKKEGRPDTERRNVHPTVKPLLQSIYWATLLLPPSLEVWRERRLLVPFAGTGSEAIGARFAGWDAITAVEMGAEYFEIARARVAYWNGFDSYEQARPAAQPEADFNDEKPLKKKPKKKRATKAPALTQLSFLED